MKIDENIDRKILHNFWMTWGISMKFSGKMWIMIKLNVTKNQGFTLFLEDKLFKKPQGQINTPSRFRINIPKKIPIRSFWKLTVPGKFNLSFIWFYM